MPLSGGESTAGRPTRSGLKAAASPAAAVLILAGAFHVYRGVPGEGVLFCAVGLAIAADSAGWLPTPPSRTFRLPGTAGSWALAAVGGLGLALLAPHGTAETLVLAVVGVAVLGVGWVQPERSGRAESLAVAASVSGCRC